MSIKLNESIYDNLELMEEDVQGWSRDDSIFLNLFTELKPSVVVEIGSWKGYTAIKMAEAVKELKLNCKIYCIDTWLGAAEFHTNLADTKTRNLLMKNGYPQIYYQFLSNIVHRGFQNVVIPIPNSSLIGSRILRYHKIYPDFVYIDGSHEYEDVKLDINNFYNLAKKNSYILVDDYESSFVGVKKAIDEFCQRNNVSKKAYGDRILIKKD